MPPQPDKTDLPDAQSTKTDLPNIPRGYVKGEATDGTDNEYIIPQFLVADIHQAFASHREKTVLGVGNVKARYDFIGLETDTVGGMVTYPPNPILSERERLTAHAEITALQKLLGISYKDASHRLYLAELEKLRAIDKHCKMMANISQCIKNSLQTIDDDPAVDVESPGKDRDKAGDADQ